MTKIRGQFTNKRKAQRAESHSKQTIIQQVATIKRHRSKVPVEVWVGHSPEGKKYNQRRIAAQRSRTTQVLHRPRANGQIFFLLNRLKGSNKNRWGRYLSRKMLCWVQFSTTRSQIWPNKPHRQYLPWRSSLLRKTVKSKVDFWSTRKLSTSRPLLHLQLRQLVGYLHLPHLKCYWWQMLTILVQVLITMEELTSNSNNNFKMEDNSTKQYNTHIQVHKVSIRYLLEDPVRYR